ncbi:MAG: HAMP domain-containing protein [Cytophagales bacterium]|nr:MAG: HAMP domain-containing protein [Cytophagales bacterium]
MQFLYEYCTTITYPTKNMRIRRLFFLIFSTTLVLALLVGAFIFIQLYFIQKDIAQIVNLEEPFEKTVLEIEIINASIANALQDYVDNNHEEQRKNISNQQKKLKEHIALYKQFAQQTEEKLLGEKLFEYHNKFDQLTDSLLTTSFRKHEKLFALRAMIILLDDLVDDLFRKYIKQPNNDILAKLKVISDFYSLNKELLNGIESYIILKDIESVQKIAQKKLNYLQVEDNYLHTNHPDRAWIDNMNKNFGITVNLGNELIQLEAKQSFFWRDFQNTQAQIDTLLNSKIQPLIAHKNQSLLQKANQSGLLIINFISITFIFILFAMYLMSMMIQKQVIIPVLALNHAAKKVAQGDFELSFQYEQKNELGELTQSFRIMAVAVDELLTKYTLLNAQLEEKVEQRTEELKQQKNLVEEKNQKITSSINYAKRIQEATLPLPDTLKEYLPEHFIFFKPRDIVSGDFYWFATRNNKIYMAAIDCTGHGIPGAFMSMIANAQLNQIVYVEKIEEVHLILEKLHKNIKIVLKQDQTNNTDGMDITLACIEKSLKKVTFASARQAFFYKTDQNPMQSIKGDARSIGGFEPDIILNFTPHEIYYQNTIQFYLASDGYKDQLGEEGRKFMISRFRTLIEEIAKHPMQQQKNILQETLKNWIGKTYTQIDDILVIGVKLEENS